VILYELLTGARPYDLSRKSLAEAVRLICEEAPRPLRQSWSGVRRLDTDIETIVGKALEKDADRRYSSAAAFSADVARQLTSQPILARPPNSLYQLRMFARRNKILVAGAVTVVVVLAAGVVVSTAQYLKAESARRTAEASLREAEAVNLFLHDMISSADPFVAKGDEITVRRVLDEAANKVETAFADQPLTEAAIRLTIGRTYRNLGDPAASEAHLEEAIRLRSMELGDTHPRVFDVKQFLAYVKTDMGKVAEGTALFRQVVDHRRERLGEEDPATLEAMYGLGCAQWAQELYEDSAQLHRKVLEARRRILGEEHRNTIWSTHNLAIALRDLGEVDEAEQLLREGLRVSRKSLGRKDPLTLEFTNQLGEVLMWQGRLADAEPLIREGLESRLEVLGEYHRSTIDSLLCLADLHRRRSEFAEAEPLVRRAVGISERVETAKHLLWAKRQLFEVLIEQGKMGEARSAWTSFLAGLKAEADGPTTSARAMNRYAWDLLTVEPEEWRDAETALAYAQRAVASTDGKNASFLDTLALAYYRTGHVARAIETQQRAIAQLDPSETSLRRQLEETLATYSGHSP
jgi:tetratricopeptide (TPR) repeat protein